MSHRISTVLRSLRHGWLALLMALAVALGGGAIAQDAPDDLSQLYLSGTSNLNDIRTLAQSAGRARVIITLNDQSIQRGLSQAQQDLVNALAGTEAVVLHRYEFVPQLLLEVDTAALDRLATTASVVGIDLDALSTFDMSTSVGVIGAGNVAGSAWARGFTGKGWVVAVLDTGVDKNHTSLAGRVVSEACYSTKMPSSAEIPGGVHSLCPGGATASTAPGSGLHCPNNVIGCDHGTHVAGTIASRHSTHRGVAPDARIIAIQVFSRFKPAFCGGTKDCVLSFTSDQIKALERVYALRNQYNIAAVNMSLGGGQHFSNCNGDARKPAIDLLRSVNIATVIATGNNGYSASMGAPACISTAISVGSTTKTDSISSFSNRASFMTLFAPGSDITSTVPGNKFASFNGTSMATPHVAGAFALYRQALPLATVDQVVTALTSHGPTINAGSFSKRRLQINAAIAANRQYLRLVENHTFEAGTIAFMGEWKLKNRNSSTDRIVKNQAGKPPVASNGQFAWQFRNSAGEDTRLIYNVNIAAMKYYGIIPGDTLTLSFSAHAPRPDTWLRATVRVNYADGTPPTLMQERITGGTSEHVTFTFPPAVITSGNVKNIRVIIHNRTTAGRIQIDDVNLQWTWIPGPLSVAGDIDAQQAILSREQRLLNDQNGVFDFTPAPSGSLDTLPLPLPAPPVE